MAKVSAEGKKTRRVKKTRQGGKLVPNADPETQTLIEGYGPWAFLEIADRAGAEDTPEKERARYLIFLAEKWAGKEKMGAEALSDLAQIAIRAAELRKPGVSEKPREGDVSPSKADEPKEDQ